MINTAPPASNSVFQVFGRLRNGFDITKLIFQVTVVQWSRSCLHMQINWVRLLATLFSVSLYLFFFFCLLFVFLTLFLLLARFPLFLLLTLLIIWCTLINIYFTLKSEVLFWKRDFKIRAQLLICILAKLTARKNGKLPRHVPLLKQLNCFKC